MRRRPSLLVRLAELIAGDHPRATIFHPQWLASRAQVAGVRHVAGFAKGLLIDVGCGRRPFYPIFAGQVDRYVGVDLPSRALAPGPGEAEVFSTALGLPFRDGTADTVLLTEVLEHLPEPAMALREVRRVLKPGGVLIVTAPMIYNVHGAPHDFFRFTRYGLRALLEHAGFDVVDVRPLGHLGTTLTVLANNFLTLLFMRNRLLAALRFTVLLPVLPVVFAAWNVIGFVVDRLAPDDAFSFDHVVVAFRA